MSVERQLMMAAGGGPQQYTISNSLRFRSSASAYLSRTPASAGNRTTWTLSLWKKFGALTSSSSKTFGVFDGTNIQYFEFGSNKLNFGIYNGASQIFQLVSTQVFRDPSSWYHFVIAFDSTQATAANRVKIYVNGTQITAFDTANYPSQNYSGLVNSTNAHALAAAPPGTYFATMDGYLTEVNFIDGQALTPSSFGETSSTTGVWIPKKYTGSYGTNGFYLNFSNNTSTTALGYDTSGNGNNWTPNNFSLTTGATYDSMIDSPTSYASGTNNVGNYAVLNPLLLWNTNGSPFTLTNGNLSVSEPGATTYGSVASTIACPTSGKWYCEITPTAVGAAKFTYIGITNITSTANVPGFTATSYAYQADGTKVNNGTATAYGAAYVANDVIGIAYDADSAALTFYKNGTSQGTAFTSITAGSYYFVVGDYATTQSSAFDANFGQRPFAYTPPSGYNALNTYNLSTPSIVDGSKQFAASLYTGTGSSLSVSGANFTPGMVWVKSRSAATDHKLTDVVRGVTKALVSNSTAAETTDTNGLTAFNSNGFTVGTDTVYNNSGATYVGWQWKAGGTAVTNTAGSITSSVSANPTAGFSVVTYTGTGANATVGHGLGIAPNMMILKRRSVGAEDWAVYHSSLANAATTLALNNTAAAVGGNATTFNSTAPTSTVFSLGTNDRVNTSSVTYVAYCFAAIPGYSAFGSYTGNGSTDGPFTYTGFRPRYLMIKRTDTAGGSWVLHDSSRDPYNGPDNKELYAESSAAEATNGRGPDLLSNGFKQRNTTFDYNASGGTYIYAAFAENPFKYSLAR